MMSEMPSVFLFFLFFFSLGTSKQVQKESRLHINLDRSKLFSVPSLIPFQFIAYSTHSKVVLSDDLS